MKFFFLLLLAVLSVAAKEIKSDIHINVTHGGLLSTVIVQHVLGSMGFKADVHRFSSANEVIEVDMMLHGKKRFDPNEFTEALSSHQITASNGQIKNKQWMIELDASHAFWNVPAITEDEGAQLERRALPYWFIVNEAQGISIEAPYGNKWYPDIAIFDSKMQILATFRTFKSNERLTFRLPQHAMYLKVSNANGMKMLKEGTWVSSARDAE